MPDLKPFIGGTYFPPEERYGQPAFKKVLERIARAWKEDHDKIVEQGSKIVEALRESQSAAPGEGKIDGSVADAAYRQIERSYDPKEGGFGNAPKFPRPVTLNFLSRFSRDPKSDSGKYALHMTLFTLRKIATGGIHDHIGGGFHRYSVDRYWHHAALREMLYDQAQLRHRLPRRSMQISLTLTSILSLARERRGRESAGLEGRVRSRSRASILDYVRSRHRPRKRGGFSAEDADSQVVGIDAPSHETAGGAFYVWTKQEIDDVLGGFG